MAYTARSSKGFKLFRGTGSDWNSASWELVRGISGWNGPNISKPTITVTNTLSERVEKITDIPDNGSITFNMYFDDGNSVHQALVNEDLNSNDYRPMKMVFASGTIMYFMGQLTGLPISGAVGSAQTTTLTYDISGATEWVFGGAAGHFVMNSTVAGTEADGAVTGKVTITIDPSSAASFKASPVAGTDYKVVGLPAGVTATGAVASSTLTLTVTGTSADKADGFFQIELFEGCLTDATKFTGLSGRKQSFGLTFA